MHLCIKHLKTSCAIVIKHSCHCQENKAFSQQDTQLFSSANTLMTFCFLLWEQRHLWIAPVYFSKALELSILFSEITPRTVFEQDFEDCS